MYNFLLNALQNVVELGDSRNLCHSQRVNKVRLILAARDTSINCQLIYKMVVLWTAGVTDGMECGWDV